MLTRSGIRSAVTILCDNSEIVRQGFCEKKNKGKKLLCGLEQNEAEEERGRVVVCVRDPEAKKVRSAPVVGPRAVRNSPPKIVRLLFPPPEERS